MSEGDIEAVIFDLWNTLIAVPPEYSPYPRLVRLLHLDSEDSFRRVMRSEWMVRSDLDAHDFYKVFCQRAGIAASARTRQQFQAIWDDYLNSVEVISNAEDVLRRIRAAGVKTAIVTNTVEPSLEVIARVGLSQHIDVIQGSSRCGYLKPDPRIFLAAIEQLDCQAERVAIVGDKLRTDILGGLILGMRAIFLEPRYSQRQVGGGLPIHAVVPGITHVPDVLGLP